MLTEAGARRLRVMRNLGLIAPSGSPYHKNGRVWVAAHRYRASCWLWGIFHYKFWNFHFSFLFISSLCSFDCNLVYNCFKRGPRTTQTWILAASFWRKSCVAHVYIGFCCKTTQQGMLNLSHQGGFAPFLIVWVAAMSGGFRSLFSALLKLLRNIKMITYIFLLGNMEKGFKL